MRRLAALALASALVVGGGCSDDDGDDAAERGTTTSSLVFSGDPDSELCTLLRDVRLDQALEEPAETTTDVEAGFTHLIDVLTRATEAAPAELRPDLGLVREGIVALDDALRAVGYSYDALAESPNAPEVSAAVNDPAFTVAGDRIQAYTTQVCGL